jgi:hypothetical protein
MTSSVGVVPRIYEDDERNIMTPGIFYLLQTPFLEHASERWGSILRLEHNRNNVVEGMRGFLRLLMELELIKQYFQRTSSNRPLYC